MVIRPLLGYARLYSNISPGWHSSALQIASKVDSRIAFALLFFNTEILAIVIPTFSASSVTLIFLLASITSMLIIIAIYFYTVKSFSDFISTAFCKSFSKTAATVAITIEIKVVTILTAIKPAGSSSITDLTENDSLMYIAAITIKMLSTIAQYFIVLKAFTEFSENTLFCPIYPSNLNA